MSSTSKPQRPRNRFFDRLTEPFTDMAREKMGQAEDRVPTLNTYHLTPRL